MISGTFIFLMIVVIAIAVLLTLVILSQNPKGGGLSSTFGGGGSQMFGVQRTNDFLDKATWALAIMIAALVILSNVLLPRGNQQGQLPEIPVNQQTLPTTTSDNANSTTAPTTGTNTPVAPQGSTAPVTAPTE